MVEKLHPWTPNRGEGQSLPVRNAMEATPGAAGDFPPGARSLVFPPGSYSSRNLRGFSGTPFTRTS